MSGTIFGCHTIGEELKHLVVEARDSVKHLTVHRTAHHNKNYLSKMSAVLRLRSPSLVPWKTLPGAFSVTHIVGTITLWDAITP